MSDLRKMLAVALQTSDLTDNPLEESALDRILALSHADRLGTLLWRLRLAYDAVAFKPAVLILSSRMVSAHETRPMRERVAECAIMEWLDDLCKTCWGRGYMVAKNAPVATHVCGKCSGTGRRRHDDHARARALGLGIEVAKKWEAKFAKAHAIISSADRATWIEVATQLERITGRKGLKEKVLAVSGLCAIMEVKSQELLQAA